MPNAADSVRRKFERLEAAASLSSGMRDRVAAVSGTKKHGRPMPWINPGVMTCRKVMLSVKKCALCHCTQANTRKPKLASTRASKRLE